MSKKPSQRRQSKPDIGALGWLARHLQAVISALGRLLRNPFSTLMTTAVIGIAIALPSGLVLFIDNVRQVSDDWQGVLNLSLFLDPVVTDQQAAQLSERIARHPEIASVRLVTKQQAMQEFRQLSGFGQALDLLEDNPLPAVILVQPTSAHNIEQLTKRLQSRQEVELAQIDLQWLQRFDAITRIAERSVFILSGLLGIAVLLVVGNTVRLEIQNRYREIEIIKLVGGTNAFIRRPFLYEGIWYGLFGALIALGLVVTALSMLQEPVQALAGLYQSDFSLAWINPNILMSILLGGPALGLSGAWVEVNHQLRKMDPQH